jgi:hypothetical protein
VEIDYSRLEKLKLLRRFLLRHLFAFIIISIFARLVFYYWNIAAEVQTKSASVAISTFSLFGPAYSTGDTPQILAFQWYSFAAIILLTQIGIFWQLLWQFRVIHLLMPKPKSKSYSWKCTIVFSIVLQFVGFVIFLAFWKEGITNRARFEDIYQIAYYFNAYFHSLMLHAGSTWHLWGGYDSSWLQQYALLYLSAACVFLCTAIGFLIIHDLGSFHRMRARMRWPKRRWSRSTFIGISIFSLALITGTIWYHQCPDLREQPTVAYWIESLFSAAGYFGNFQYDFCMSYSHREGFGIIVPGIFKLIGTPFGSPVANGLLALAMFIMLPIVKRLFTRKAIIATVIAFVGLICISVMLPLVLPWSKTSMWYLSLPLWVIKIPLALLIGTYFIQEKSAPTHSTGSLRSGPS